MLRVALLSLAKKSECGKAQLSPWIAGFNVLNKLYVRTTTRNQGVSQLDANKIGYRMTEKKIQRILTWRSRAYYVSAGQKGCIPKVDFFHCFCCCCCWRSSYCCSFSYCVLVVVNTCSLFIWHSTRRPRCVEWYAKSFSCQAQLQVRLSWDFDN